MIAVFPLRGLLPLLFLSLAAAGSVWAQQQQGPPPLTTRTDAVGRLLNAWAAEKSAAGLKLIRYENRDGGHSPLAPTLYPGLQFYQPTEEEKKAGRDRGVANQIRPEPTVGNCSMAAHPTVGGSLPRLYYTEPGGLLFLNQQYLASNLFVYPEHLDHDPGGNGVGGYGDLFPTNSACVIISQGSSFTDQPFVSAVLATIAAFDPDVLTLLIRNRLLMPTVQAIFRQSNKMVRSEADYFTGRAHPVVFDGGQLDEEKMVLTAHSMTRAAVPPVALLKVVSEREAVAGRDFFEKPAITSEKLTDTPTVIARVFRSHAAEYELVVAAASPGDLLRRPLSFRWQLLQGDPKLVSIEPGEQGQARIRVRWHGPQLNTTGIRSHRVDIGVFASNGVATSAPAFVTFYMPPNETRSYDAAGRVAEIFYESPNPDLGLPQASSDLRWLEVCAAIARKGEGIGSGLMEQAFTSAQRSAAEKLLLAMLPRANALPVMEKDETKKGEAAKARAELERDLAAALTAPAPGKDAGSLRGVIEAGFEKIAAHESLFTTFQGEIEKRAAASSKASAAGDIAGEVRRLVALGVLRQGAKGATEIMGPATSGQRWMLRGLNLTVMSQALYPAALERSTAPAYVDPRLSTPKPWRDVFDYDKAGKLLGWARHHQGRVHRFNAAGQMLADDPAAKPAAVTYRDDGAGRLTFLPP